MIKTLLTISSFLISANSYSNIIPYGFRSHEYGDERILDEKHLSVITKKIISIMNSEPEEEQSPGAYYVDASNGSDENSGRSEVKAWRTLKKVNAHPFIPGDTILLKGEETFPGGISKIFTHDNVFNSIIFDSYGTGKAKIILGQNDSVAVSIKFTKHIKVIIRNIIIEGLYNPITETGGYSTSKGIYVWNFSLIKPLEANKVSHVNISNCEIHNVKSPISIASFDFGKTITSFIDSNHVYNTGGAIGMSFNWHSNSRIYANKIHDVYGYSGNLYNYGIVIALCKDVSIERNLIYNIGHHSKYSGIGIHIGASKNIKVRYNEIYGIKNNSHSDCQAINFENGTDSSLAEFNYIHDTPGMGILISGNSSFESITASYRPYAKERGSIDSGSADYNIVRFNLMKNLCNTSDSGFMGIKIASGIFSPKNPGRNNQIYNNTIIYTSKRNGGYGFALSGNHDSTKIFNNIVISDSMTYMYVDSPITKTNAFINNNMYWDKNNNAFTSFIITNPYSSYSNFNTWNTATGWESSKLNYNPLLTNALNTVGDTLNNPFLIETLSKYIPTDVSLANGSGIVINSYTRNAPTVDIAGNSLKGKMCIGAFVNTNSTSYFFQEEIKR